MAKTSGGNEVKDGMIRKAKEFSLICVIGIFVAANTQFTMEWTPGENCQGYQVERSLEGGPFELIQEVYGLNAKDALHDMQSAVYRVRGFADREDGRTFGPYSDESEIIIGSLAPTAPSGLIIKWLK